MATQVIFLLGILVFILLFRDLIADGAGEMFGSFGPDDVQVQQNDDAQPNQLESSSSEERPAGETDARP